MYTFNFITSANNCGNTLFESSSSSTLSSSEYSCELNQYGFVEIEIYLPLAGDY
mgnify:CR=1 FL=1